MNKLLEIAGVFLKLGFIAFGGPAAHIAVFEEEVVKKRKWLDHQHFLDIIGAVNLIPGPNSTEVCIHCGYIRGGIPGLFVAGLSFMMPAVLITGVFAFLYVEYGSIPAVESFLYGIKPAVIIIILNAVYTLGKKAAKGSKLILIGVTTALLNFLGLSEIYSILAGGFLGALFLIFSNGGNKLNTIFPFVYLTPFFLAILQQTEKHEASLTKLFLSFLKIGAVWFGSGYVLVAYFDGEFVQNLNWLTRNELLDAIAVGQFTPGPFLTSATFVGYQIAGAAGALTATAAISIPSFIFVMILKPIIPKIRKSKYLSKFLDAVNVSAVAVMFVVALKLGAEVLVDWRSILIAVLSAAAFFGIKKINAAYVIIGGAVLGYLLSLI